MNVVVVNVKDEYSTRDSFANAIIEEDGAIKWESNGHYLMDDTMMNIIRNGFSPAFFSIRATQRKREVQNQKAIEVYSKQKRKASNEEMAEMRANFGKGTTIVDVFTGEEFVL